MDGNVSRNELEKLRIHALAKSSNCDTLKCKCADILIHTNEFQNKHYYVLLPDILDQLQKVEKRRVSLIRDSLKDCTSKEKAVLPIISGFHDTIAQALVSFQMFQWFIHKEFVTLFIN